MKISRNITVSQNYVPELRTFKYCRSELQTIVYVHWYNCKVVGLPHVILYVGKTARYFYLSKLKLCFFLGGMLYLQKDPIKFL